MGISQRRKAGTRWSQHVSKNTVSEIKNTSSSADNHSVVADVASSTITLPINQYHVPSLSLYGIIFISIVPASIIYMSVTSTDTATKENISTPIEYTPLNSAYTVFINSGTSGIEFWQQQPVQGPCLSQKFLILTYNHPYFFSNMQIFVLF